MTREALLLETMVELADTLVDDFDVIDLLTLLADRCQTILGVAATGLMLGDGDGKLRVIASSSEAMRVLELFELETQEGPCVDCYATGKPVINVDLDGDGQWPRFSAQALTAGFHSVHALPMRLRGQVIGALNLFHLGTGRMETEDVVAAQALSDIATVAVLQHRAVDRAQELADNLNHALNSRVEIEQAKGVLAERMSVSLPYAFELMRRHARSHNVRLASVANAVVEGTLTAVDLQAAAPRR